MPYRRRIDALHQIPFNAVWLFAEARRKRTLRLKCAILSRRYNYTRLRRRRHTGTPFPSKSKQIF